ncbi:MAG: low molecular weight protein-tyrosine-phosphatase [Nocardioides sp.]
MPSALPLPRTGGHYRIGLVCLGNICRSPVADVVLTQLVADAGLAERVEVASCGTAGWHVGKPMDERSAATLADAGYDPTHHVAQQFDATWPEHYDLLLAMDEQNLVDLGGRDERVGLLRDTDPEAPTDQDTAVPDPYYGGASGFEEVLAMVERSCAVLVTLLPAALDAQRDLSDDPDGAR